MSVAELIAHIQSGETRDILIGDRVIVKFRQQDIVMDVIGIDADGQHTITLQSHNVLPYVAEYDENMSYNWQKSSLRKALNAQSVMEDIEVENPGLTDYIMSRRCNELSDGSADKIFILSEQEIMGGYEYYDRRLHKLNTPIKIDDDGECRGYWLRSVSKSRGTGTWYYGTGYISRAAMGMKYAVAPCAVVGLVKEVAQ